MLASVNHFRSCCTGLTIATVVLASAAVAEGPDRRAGEDRWVPALAVVSGVTIQDQEAAVSSFDFTNAAPLRNPTDGNDLAVSPYVGANLQLMAPAITAIPGRPRVFAAGEILPTFAVSRNIANEGNPSEFAFPPGLGQIPELGITGQGSQTTAEVQTLAYGAAVGVAFPFVVRGFQLRAKPSVGWIRYEVAVEGTVHAAFCAGGGNLCRTDAFPPGFARLVDLRGGDSQWFNGIGPGLEIEMDVYRFSQFGVSVFLDGHAYRVLGNRSVEFSDSIAITDDLGGPDTYAANWSFEVDPWIYRAGLGLRIHWLGR
jgi:hypothetical protein